MSVRQKAGGVESRETTCQPHTGSRQRKEGGSEMNLSKPTNPKLYLSLGTKCPTIQTYRGHFSLKPQYPKWILVMTTFFIFSILKEHWHHLRISGPTQINRTCVSRWMQMNITPVWLRSSIRRVFSSIRRVFSLFLPLSLSPCHGWLNGQLCTV